MSQYGNGETSQSGSELSHGRSFQSGNDTSQFGDGETFQSGSETSQSGSESSQSGSGTSPFGDGNTSQSGNETTQFGARKPFQSRLTYVLGDINLPSSQWIVQGQDRDYIAVCKVSDQPCLSTQSIVVTHCIIIKDDMSWSLSVHGSNVNVQKCGVLSNMPRKMCSSSLQQLVSLLDICTVCPGHPDQKFIQMVESKKGRLMAKNGLDVVTRVDGFSPVTLNGERYNKTIRISTFEMLVHGGKCVSCVSYRDSLRPIYHRWKKQKSLSPSHRQSTES